MSTPDVTNYINAALNAISAPSEPQYSEPSQPVTDDLAYLATAANALGKTDVLPEVAKDLKTMSPTELNQKYGTKQATQLMADTARGTIDYYLDKTTERSPGELIHDAATNIGTGFINPILDAAATSVAISPFVPDEWGTKVVQANRAFQDYASENWNTNANMRQRRAYGAEDAVMNLDSERKYAQDIASGKSRTESQLRKIGRDILNSTSHAFGDGGRMFDITTQGLGSLPASVLFMKGAGVISKLGMTGASKVMSGMVGGTIAKETINKISNAIAWNLGLGAMEGSSGYAETMSKIQDMSIEDLYNNSPEFPLLVQAYMEQAVPQTEAEERAKNDVSYKAAGLAGMLQGVNGLITGQLSKGFSKTLTKPFRPRTLGAMGGEVLGETAEEAGQGGGGQLVQNYAVQKYANRTQDITEGVGQNLAESAIGGMTSSGLTEAPGVATGAFLRTAKGIKEQTNKFLNSDNKNDEAFQRLIETNQNYNQFIDQLRSENAEATRKAEETGQPKEETAADLVSKFSQSLILTDEQAKEYNVQNKDSIPAMQELAGRISQAKDGDDITDDAVSLYKIYNNIDSIFDEEKYKKFVQEVISTKNQHIQESFDKYNTTVQEIINNDQVRNAVEQAEQLLASQKIGEINEQTLKTPEGQKDAQRIFAKIVSGSDTEVSDKDLDTILKNSKYSKLTQDQLDILANYRAIFKNITKQRKVYDQISGDETFVSKNINEAATVRSWKTENHRSLRRHFSDIIRATRSKNPKKINEAFTDLKRWIDTQQNKLNAGIESYQNGDGKPVKYSGWKPKNLKSKVKDQHPRPITNEIYGAHTPNGEKLLDNIYLDLYGLIDAYNVLSDMVINDKVTINRLPYPSKYYDKVLPHIADFNQKFADVEQRWQGGYVSSFNKPNEETKPTSSDSGSEPSKDQGNTPTPSPNTPNNPSSNSGLNNQDNTEEQSSTSNSDSGFDFDVDNSIPPGYKLDESSNSVPVKTEEFDFFEPEEINTSSASSISEPETKQGTENKGISENRGEPPTESAPIKPKEPTPTSSSQGEATVEVPKTTNKTKQKRKSKASKNEDTQTGDLFGEDINSQGNIPTEPTATVTVQSQTETSVSTDPDVTESNEDVHEDKSETKSEQAETTIQAFGSVIAPQLKEGFKHNSHIFSKLADVERPLKALWGFFHKDLAELDESSIDFLASDEEDNINLYLKKTFMNPKIRKDFANLLGTLQTTILAQMNEDLYAKNKTGKGDKKKNPEGYQLIPAIRDMETDPKSVLCRGNNKQLAFVEKVTDRNGNVKYQYNPYILQMAGLAYADFLLDYQGIRSPINSQTKESVFGDENVNLSAEEITFLQGQNPGLMINELAGKIQDYLCVLPQSNIASGLSSDLFKGLAAAMFAATLNYDKKLAAAHQPTLFTTHTLTRSMENAKSEIITFDDTRISVNEFNENLYQCRGILSEALLSRRNSNYIFNEKDVHVSNNYLHVNIPGIHVTKSEKSACERQSKTEYKIDKKSTAIICGMGENALFDFLNIKLNNEQNYNVNDLEAIKSRQFTVTSALADMKTALTRQQIIADEINKQDPNANKSFFDIPRFFPGDITKVGRVQQRPSCNPVGNKALREMVLCTWGTIDLNNKDHMNVFKRAILQAFGQKIQNFDQDTIDDLFNKFENSKTLKTALSMIDNVMEGVDINAMPKFEEEYDEQGNIIKNSFNKEILGSKSNHANFGRAMRSAIQGISEDMFDGKKGELDITMLGLKALIDYHSYAKAKEAGQTSLETSLYIEPDGPTDGSINGTALISTGDFTPREITIQAFGGNLLRKGTIRSLSDIRKLKNNQGQTPYASDLYTEDAKNMNQTEKGLFSKINALDLNECRIKVEGLDQYDTQAMAWYREFYEGKYNEVKKLTSMFAKGLDVKKLENGVIEISYKRAFSKKSAQTKIYGSGAGAIATNLFYEIENGIYSTLSKVQKRLNADPTKSVETAFNEENIDFNEFQNLLESLFTSIPVEIQFDREVPSRATFRLNSSINSLFEPQVNSNGRTYNPYYGIKQGKIRLTKETIKGFTFTPQQQQIIVKHIQSTLGRVMVETIDNSLTPSFNPNMSLLTAVSNLASNLFIQAYKAEYEKIYNNRPEGMGLSPDETKEIYSRLKKIIPIFKSAEHLLPLFKMDGQIEESYLDNINKRNKNERYSTHLNKEYSFLKCRVNNKMPSDPGVLIKPLSVINAGDASMMRNGFNDPNLKASMNTYDGMQTAVATALQMAKIINKANYDAITSNNIYEDMFNLLNEISPYLIANSNKFQLPLYSKDTYTGMYREEKVNSDPGHQKVSLQQTINDLIDDLKMKAISRKARLKVMKKHLSDNHMCGVSDNGTEYAPFKNTDLSDVYDAEEVANKLNEEYAEELAKLSNNKSTEKEFTVNKEYEDITEQQSKSLDVIADNDPKIRSFYGRRINEWLYTQTLNKNSPFTSNKLMQAIARSRLLEHCSMVIFTPDKAKEIQDAYGVGPEANGWIDTNNNTIYIQVAKISKGVFTDVFNDPNVRYVFEHEILHAATVAAVTTCYSHNFNEKEVDPNIIEAVKGINRLMQDMMKNYPDISHIGSQREIRDFNTLKGILEDNNYSEQTKVLEFIAYAMTNSALLDKINRLPLNDKNVLSIKNIISRLMKFIKQIFLGNNKTDEQYAKEASQTPLAQFEFYTQLLIKESGELVPSVLNSKLRDRPILAHLSDTLFGTIDTIKKSSDYKAIYGAEGKLRDVTQQAIITSKAAIESTNLLNAFTGLTPEEVTEFNSTLKCLLTAKRVTPLSRIQLNKVINNFFKENPISSFEDKSISNQVIRERSAKEKYKALSEASDLTFLAFALSSDEMRSRLSTLKVPKADKSKATDPADKWLENFGFTCVNALESFFTKTRKSRNSLKLLNDLYHGLRSDLTWFEMIANAWGNVNNKINTIMAKALPWTLDATEDSLKNLADATNSKAIKTISNIAEAVNLAYNNEGDIFSERMLHLSNSTSWLPELVKSCVSDIFGVTEAIRDTYDLIKPVKVWAQQTRDTYKNNVPKFIKEHFKNRPSKKTSKIIYRGLAKVDAGALINIPTHLIHRLYTEDRFLNTEIAKRETLLAKVDPKYASYVKTQGKQLATYMMTGKTGKHLLVNADAIAHGIGTNKFKEHFGLTKAMLSNIDESLVSKIDELITMYAIKQISKEDLSTIRNLLKQEPEGMNLLFGLLMKNKKDEFAKATGFGRFNAVKGYIPSSGSEGRSVIIKPLYRAKELKELGYKPLKLYNDGFNYGHGSLCYYYRDFNANPIFSEGAIQIANLTSSGCSLETGLMTQATAGFIPEVELGEADIYSDIDSTNEYENLRPIYYEDRGLIGYECMVDSTIFDDKLDRSQDIFDMIGIQSGRLIEEEAAKLFNDQTVKALYKQYKEASNKDDYINIFDSRDPVIRDAVKLLPAYVKISMKKYFGARTCYVRKDQVADMIGQRNASIGDIWTGNSRWSRKTQERVRNVATKLVGSKAFKYATMSENALMFFMATARNNIIVKSTVVPTINAISNIYQMMSFGIGLFEIGKAIPQKLHEVEMYSKQMKRISHLDVLIAANTRHPEVRTQYEAERKRIFKQIESLSIFPLIANGEFATIADIGTKPEDIDLMSGKVAEWIEAKVDKLPSGIKTLGKYAFMTKDTALYKMIEKSVQYGDFISKAIVYDHLIKEGKSMKEALYTVKEEFVDYDKNAGRTRQYLENVGLLWFYNYKLRILKATMRSIKNHPFHTLMTMALPSHAFFGNIGLPIQDNLFSKLFSDSLGYTMGPNLGPDSFTKLPAAQVVSTLL